MSYNISPVEKERMNRRYQETVKGRYPMELRQFLFQPLQTVLDKLAELKVPYRVDPSFMNPEVTPGTFLIKHDDHKIVTAIRVEDLLNNLYYITWEFEAYTKYDYSKYSGFLTMAKDRLKPATKLTDERKAVNSKRNARRHRQSRKKNMGSTNSN